MLLTPKRWKYRKQFRTHLKGKSTRGSVVAFGEYGLKATTSEMITNKQIEAARKVIVRHTRKVGQLWIRIFPDKPVTSKGHEAALGAGKGAVDHYVFPIRPGRIIFEIDGLKEEVAKEALEGASMKLPIKTKFIKKEN